MKTNLFISWSGSQSQQIANALREWLPNVIQNIDPWMSKSDMEKGSRWAQELAEKLTDASVGLICLTPENQHAPWLLFEAGAISNALEKNYVCTYLYKLECTEITGPLSQFQHTEANKSDTNKLMYTFNKALGESRLQKEVLDKSFEKWWPDLEEKIKKIPAMEKIDPPKRSQEDMLKELLELTRARETGALPLKCPDCHQQLCIERDQHSDHYALTCHFCGYTKLYS
ncbi:MAG: toll/interleukin-1 receptor domain-containing protein [Deltaproteobacteria bacterium]|nr:toll/interleukin-1 receptor domain-containing protein [Deltaproteobacteria bacterium]